MFRNRSVSELGLMPTLVRVSLDGKQWVQVFCSCHNLMVCAASDAFKCFVHSLGMLRHFRQGFLSKRGMEINYSLEMAPHISTGAHKYSNNWSQNNLIIES